MRQSKLFLHLALLSSSQWRLFERYVASPYFNLVPRLSTLLAVIRTHAFENKKQDVTEEQVFAVYLPGLKFDQNRLRKDCTALLKLLVDFLAQEAYQDDHLQRRLYLLQQLNVLGDSHFYPSYHADALEELNAAVTAFDKEYWIGFERYRFDLGLQKAKSDANLGALVEAAELEYCVKKMEMYYLERNHLIVTGKGTLREDQEFLNFVSARLSQLPKITQMYFHLYLCTVAPTDEASYRAFRELLMTATLSKSVEIDMYATALNYCARRLAGGNAAFLAETHLLHQEMLHLGILDPEHGRLHQVFKNAITVACKMADLDWARGLMTRFAPLLDLPENKTAFHFASGIIALAAGELVKAEPHFHRVLDDYENIFYGLDARTSLVRIFYEMHNLLGLESLLESYRMFLKRHTGIAKARKSRLLTFIRLTRKLVQVDPHDRSAILALREEIQEHRNVPSADWLLERVERFL